MYIDYNIQLHYIFLYTYTYTFHRFCKFSVYHGYFPSMHDVIFEHFSRSRFLAFFKIKIFGIFQDPRFLAFFKIKIFGIFKALIFNISKEFLTFFMLKVSFCTYG